MGWRRLLVLVTAAAILSCSGALASPIPPDPIVRVRDGGFSIPIDSLPFAFGFIFELDGGGTPINPDAGNCMVGQDATVLGFDDPAEPYVSCGFQNKTGQFISLLDFLYTTQMGPTFAQDPDGFFVSAMAFPSAAQFAGGGIPPCIFDGEFCFGGEFIIDWVGYSNGSSISMTASQVPEPAALLLVGSGVVLAGLRRRQRRH